MTLLAPLLLSNFRRIPFVEVNVLAWDLKRVKKEEIKPEQFWKKPTEIIHKTGLKVLAWGEPEVGKTHFALTFPEPVYVVDTDLGVAPLLAKPEFRDKDIRIYDAVKLDLEKDEVDPIGSLEMLEKALTALRDVKYGTIVIDTITDIWQWIGAWLEVVATRRTQTGQPYQFEWGNRRLISLRP